jgi:hypothetical protein
MPRGKKECSSCNKLVGIRTSKCSCGYIFAKPEVKKNKPNKLKVLGRLVDIPDKNKRLFYSREFKMMKTLTERYSLEFLSIVDFGKKFDSMAYLISPKLKDTLDKKWRAFNYRVDKNKYKDYTIGEKYGEDKKITKKKTTTRDFLDER